ncbi:MAG: dehypoxanthine futalosine cyclase [Deltaproteobacteria bacterium]|nr:dehypoxanthine futalosine cyclase [Deltaproteobacteria bacterium]
MSARRLRLAAVSFLNARPITHGIERGLVGKGRFELWFDLPARCAEAVAEGEADLALMPVASYAAARGELRLVPGIAIASRGPVRTVLLLGDVPWEEMETIVLDAASRTSQVLVQILGRARGLAPRCESAEHDRIVDLVRGRRGGLLIGDACFAASRRFAHVYDLGAEWTARVGLPFVYAAWAGRPDALAPGDVALLQESLALGLAEREAIARGFAEPNRIDIETSLRYLTRNIHYELGASELCGAAAFVERGHQVGLFGEKPALRFYANEARPRPAAARLSPSLDGLLSEAAAGRRLSFDEGVALCASASLHDLGQAADARRGHLHPHGVATYIIDRNINYTNACTTACHFCNFHRSPGDARVYVLGEDELAAKLRETVDLGGLQVLFQGGVNPDLGLTYFEDLFRFMKSSFPLAIHGLSPEEIRRLAEREDLSIPAVIERLVAAGLDSIPGGGAEILDDEIRRRISPRKCSVGTWLEVMREAHRLGLRSTATMVFGFGEEPRHVVGHLDKLRVLQDETAGFTAFICWSFQAEGSRLPLQGDTSATRYLRMLALARLYLDNFPNLQVSWVTMGPAVGQVGLRFGGNDFGSAMIEENVVAQAGAVFKLSASEIEACIRWAGFSPRRRNMRYEWIE